MLSAARLSLQSAQNLVPDVEAAENEAALAAQEADIADR